MLPGVRTAREIAEQRRVDELGGGIRNPDGSKNLENEINPIGLNRCHLMEY